MGGANRTRPSSRAGGGRVRIDAIDRPVAGAIPRGVAVVVEDAVEIRALGEEDAGAFRALRLRALRDHPEAFGSSYEETRALPPEEWERRFRSDWVEGGVMFGAFVGGRLVGTVGVARATREKQRHRAGIRSVYVAPEARGRGIGAALMAAAIGQARAWGAVEVLELSVGVGNAAARRLYAGFGFVTYGVERWALKVDGQDVDEALMVLRLDR